ncbi:TonB-dependent siderophore receptor [Paraburkholderia sp. FT54]|uniref:TonB-dependent receptor n=1 Tax=Paraburkholderia sp. FT54 TaxID=3074437 RepID=UPI002877362C|nr:TonB-dependent siderophore receptor [Paraburkholderia sp. FT54]WNC95026.1 TonB-dependent siderophore receptor [Paraburkholderia sp. FT54]
MSVNAATAAVARDHNVNDPYQVTGVSKTGTALGDLPMSVQEIPRGLLTEQGATKLQQAVSNASGVSVGGTDAKGFFDHFMIRGLQAQVYTDGFSDGDQVNGVVHSLNGVERVEILEGPGSALFGSGPPGGTINIVHYTPSPQFHYGADVQAASFGTVTGSAYVTGPTGVPGLNYRVDATGATSDGFRDLAYWNKEIRTAFQWKLGDHKFDFSIEAQDTRSTPDSYGLIYLNGTPIHSVPIDAKYSTPFAFARSNYVRPTLTDAWRVSDFLTINNRLSFLHRSLEFDGNGDSSSTQVVGDEVVHRQLRQQDDSDNTLDYQLEPVWKFKTGSVGHTLLTGFEYMHQAINTDRATADLPNIPDVFAPVPPETSIASLTFQCNATHSCDNDHLVGNFYSLYATDQVDVTDQLKLRAGVRKDWWDTSLTPNITVPGRVDNEGEPVLAGHTYTRNDAPVSWNIGALYKLTPWMSPYFGISRSYLTNFNSEDTQSGIGEPETALQYEAGVKFSFLDDRYVLNTALFDVSRSNVASPLTLNGVETVVFDSQKTRGAEASLDASITRQWHLIANFTAQHAYVTSNPQGVSAVGNNPQDVPAYMANLWTTYDFSIYGVPGFHVGAGVNYMSRVYSDITNINSVPAYVIANAAFGYRAHHWGVDLNVHNLTNRRYFVAANMAGAYVGEPLSAYVTLHADF